ncbi:hypothetical protein F4808DRAFT_430755 [Astrocystis sublimbata]|nr:hypothetical protein F4808DRAFT_430755 [Astrocystis sublimbata]
MDLKKQFGIISAPISDISPHSAFLAYSYMSLGPRKGRRVPFHTSQDVRESSDHTYSSDVAHGTLPGEEVWSHKHFSRQRNATNPGPDKDCRIASSKQRTVYPCSSCPRTFNTRYLQKRHEDSIHNLRVQWVCGPGLLADLGLETTCPICKIAIRVGNKDTTCPHRFEECWAKRKDERAFSRKDTLNQHIRIVHCKGDATLLSTACIDLNSWKEDTDTANRGIVTQPALSSGIPERPKQTRHHIEQ